MASNSNNNRYHWVVCNVRESDKTHECVGHPPLAHQKCRTAYAEFGHECAGHVQLKKKQTIAAYRFVERRMLELGAKGYVINMRPIINLNRSYPSGARIELVEAPITTAERANNFRHDFAPELAAVAELQRQQRPRLFEPAAKQLTTYADAARPPPPQAPRPAPRTRPTDPAQQTTSERYAEAKQKLLVDPTVNVGASTSSVSSTSSASTMSSASLPAPPSEIDVRSYFDEINAALRKAIADQETLIRMLPPVKRQRDDDGESAREDELLRLNPAEQQLAAAAPAAFPDPDRLLADIFDGVDDLPVVQQSTSDDMDTV